MISARSESAPYGTRVTDGQHDIVVDTSLAHGGAQSGFSPHDLLEAALGACVNITLRMYADRHQVPLEGVTVHVTLNLSCPEEAVFRYEVELHGAALTEAQRTRLLQIAQACPVRKTLSRSLRFEASAPVPAGDTTPGSI